MNWTDIKNIGPRIGMWDGQLKRGKVMICQTRHSPAIARDLRYVVRRICATLQPINTIILCGTVKTNSTAHTARRDFHS